MPATVARFMTAHEAHLGKLRLASRGIEAFVADENVNTIQPLLAPALGWVRLQVDEEDLPEARRILTSDDPGAEAALARLGPQHLGQREIAGPTTGARRTLPGVGRWLVWLVLAAAALSLLRGTPLRVTGGARRPAPPTATAPAAPPPPASGAPTP